ncbi:hypothetical protein EJ04DRAFT_549217 [Polyplosphaeria fusca]|uniref:Zn(2)-C6 fungal-type domain-containing protein n=1 Tax=Polyplosphaeria fusca TaxID=682080 RepID=A0A9P4R9X6_9PLEO|nr:hypothetical protein EJ04DRAFT_549217 [Polyplosphaeria fusca]
MVGVPKSTGCLTCRRRKIKCDETWPACLNCQKNGKCCPGPPARHTFRESGLKLATNPATTTFEDPPGILPQKSKRLTQLTAKWSENGAVFQKFRISNKAHGPHLRTSPVSPHRTSDSASSPPTLPRLPSPSQHQDLSRAFVDALCVGGAGHQMSAFGPFIRDVPARIGHNVALDASVACLVNAHSSMVHKRRANEIVSPRLYLRAVQALQTCLDDPCQGMSSDTLCASVLLSIVEALAGPRIGNRYLAHVGGAGRLLELQGPLKCQDRFSKEILRFIRGGIVMTTLFQRKKCFLTLPAWHHLAFDRTGLSFEDCLYTEILEHMAEIPGLLAEMKEVRQSVTERDTIVVDTALFDELIESSPAFDVSSEDSSPALHYSIEPYAIHGGYMYPSSGATLLQKFQNMKEALCTLGVPLGTNLTNGTAAIEVPSIDPTTLITQVFHFSSWRVAVAYSCYWSLLILTNRAIIKLLPPYDSLAYAIEAQCRTIAFEICKTWEYAWASKPIGAFHVGLSFIMAYDFCGPDVQDWILKSLNSLLDYQMVDTFRWNDEIIRKTAGRMVGEGPDLVFTSSKGAI